MIFCKCMNDIVLEKSWKNILSEEFSKPYFNTLRQFVRRQYKEKMVYPPPKDIFKALDVCPFDTVRVVILGQDPYHNAHQANGLCFSVQKGVGLPPSLKNIFTEIKNDTGVESVCADGDLSRWASQGVLLLNSVLTVEAHKPASHKGMGWEQFTDAIIERISREKEGVVFLLWGNYAKEKGKNIDTRKHFVLTSAHPSPFSARSGFFGSKHFSQTNEYLKKRGEQEIQW